MHLGQCYALQARFGDAEDCFTHAIGRRPESPWPYFDRGVAELERKEYAPARLDFDRALDLRPDLTAARVNRALAHIGLGDDARAQLDLTTALERGTAGTRVYFIRAQVRTRLGDPEGAARDRAEGLRRTPDEERSWIARGLARLHEDPQGALADFQQALARNPHSRAALQNTANALSESLGRPKEAVAFLDRVVSLYPDFVPARVGRGVLLARLGDRTAAHRDAREAEQRDQSNETRYRIACIYALTSRIEPADRQDALRMLAAVLVREAAWLRVARSDPDLDALRTQAEFQEILHSSAPSETES
jgi:tetratricopeptide (TPR) repeat protein